MKSMYPIPFMALLGIEVLSFEASESRIALDLRAELTNSHGLGHGGVTMTLLDVAMAMAARAPTEAGGEATASVMTLEMKTSFLRPALGRLLAQGRRLHATTSFAFCEGEVRDVQGQLIAHATGTFKVLHRPTATTDAD